MRLKLRASIVLAVVVGLLIPVSVGSLVTLGQREESMEHRLAADHKRLAEILTLGMQEPLWNLSHDAGRPLFESVLGDERVASAIVRDKKFGTFLAQEHAERRKGRQFKIERDVVYNNAVIGYVSVEMDSGLLDAELASDRRAFVFTALGQLLLSMLLILALLQVRLLAPLRRLMHDSQRLALRDLAEPFNWRDDDELGNLGARLETTRQALQALFHEIENKNLTLVQDIERRALTEKELQRHRDHLEELVRERTAELTIAKERAEVANKSKGTFLASMSHELRTPLNAILGYAQLFKRDKNLDDRQVAGLTTIQQSGEHLLTLITDLLDLSKIEAGKFELYNNIVDLPAFLQVITDIIRIKAEQKGLLFIYEAPQTLPHTVLTDEKHLRQILLNLLGNAIKFTDAGQVGLRVHSFAVGGTSARVRFEVFDTGIGLSEDQFETVFLPFEQVSDPQRRFGGTGLGLTISRQLARLMESDITIVSEMGKGSTFSVELTLPVVDGEVAVEAPRQRLTGYRAPVRKVLIVDDVAANRVMLADMLKGLGFSVVEAADGVQGLEEAEAARPDLILMDIMMPVMDGLEATRRIRLHPDLRDMPIIAVSASATWRDQEDSMAAGASTFMVKPLDQELLLHQIGAFLDLTWISEQPPQADSAKPSPIVTPPPHEMDVLHGLALAGNMRDIRRHATHIAELDERYRPFADKLNQLAKTYQSKAIMELVAEYMQGRTRQ